MKNDTWKLTRNAVLLAVLLAGCAVAPEPKPAQVKSSGHSPSFRWGYADGCGSAGNRSQLRNEVSYNTETDYMMGWNDGFSVCRKSR